MQSEYLMHLTLLDKIYSHGTGVLAGFLVSWLYVSLLYCNISEMNVQIYFMLHIMCIQLILTCGESIFIQIDPYWKGVSDCYCFGMTNNL